MYDDGEPKPVETLSKGQKATALLPLILRNRSGLWKAGSSRSLTNSLIAAIDTRSKG
jgi:hypothetical protein